MTEENVQLVMIQEWRRRYADGSLMENPEFGKRLSMVMLTMFTSRKHRKELSLSSPKAATGQAGPLVQELSRASEIMWLFKATGDLQVINGWLGAVLEKYGEEEEE